MNDDYRLVRRTDLDNLTRAIDEIEQHVAIYDDALYDAAEALVDNARPPGETDGEHCFDCGRGYSIVWTAPDDLWNQLTGWGEGGLLCPDCFAIRCQRAGLFVRFVP